MIKIVTKPRVGWGEGEGGGWGGGMGEGSNSHRKTSSFF